jgi:hypothetical protein
MNYRRILPEMVLVNMPLGISGLLSLPCVLFYVVQSRYSKWYLQIAFVNSKNRRIKESV